MKIDYIAKLVVHDADSQAIMLRTALWLKAQSKTIIKEVREQQEKYKGKKSGFAKTCTMRLMK